jgi:ABC-type lipoprotein export system ATPase subunit
LGSIWRKWDLHVHTPDSIVHKYDGSDPWDRFFTEIERLPPEMSVLGVNDYLFVDGYRRVLAEFRADRFPKLEAIFPVVELRLSQLVGVGDEWNRINYHVIFEEQFDPDVIEAQFISGLSAKAVLVPGEVDTPWSGILSRQGLASFGATIRASLPEDHQARHNETDLVLGFNNFVVTRDAVDELLRHSALRDRTITAIGKAEWGTMRWRDQSIGIKKDLVNSATVIFTASESPEHYSRSIASLVQQEVNHHLLDCSDAHTWTDSVEKDRLGNCLTWISAQPTLDGLRHAITEFDTRVFVGDCPPKIEAVRLRPTDHLRSVRITRADDAPEGSHQMFDVEVQLNPGFVAVLGNKGKGKSALLDTIALIGDCSTEDDFTFLSRDRFRNPNEDRAREHKATLTWGDGAVVEKRLDEHVDRTLPPRLTYIPQRLLDEICSADPGEPSVRFARELGAVLFAHVSQADRLGAASLQELIDQRSRALDARMNALRSELSSLNGSIAEAEQRLLPGARTRLESVLDQLRTRLNDLADSEPQVPPVADSGTASAATAAVDALKVRRDGLAAEISTLETEDSGLAVAVDAGDQLKIELGTLQEQWQVFVRENTERLDQLGIALDDVASLAINLEPVDTAIAQRRQRRHVIAASRDKDVEGTVGKALADVLIDLREAEERLDEPARLRAEAEAAHARWEKECARVRDGSDEVQGIANVQVALTEFDELPAELAELKTERFSIARRIHSLFADKVAIYEELYEPARRFIDQHPLAELCQLSFGAGLRETNFEARLFDVISRQAVGTFAGRAEGSARLRDRMDKVNFQDADSVCAFLEELDTALQEDQRTSPASPVDLSTGLRRGHTVPELFDLVFGLSYLEPHHSLRYRNTELDHLSPGEKGTILLMFYLLVDPSRSPLLLDQPDENLDNQTVKDLLVPAIKEAATRRQLLIVTHNPNVAVVADADQLIVADREGDRFVYTTGAIEDAPINRDVVDVLEGTWPAFRNRHVKYQEPAAT